MYSNGEGVPQDNGEAHMWLNLAASRLSGAVCASQKPRNTAAEARPWHRDTWHR